MGDIVESATVAQDFDHLSLDIVAGHLAGVVEGPEDQLGAPLVTGDDCFLHVLWMHDSTVLTKRQLLGPVPMNADLVAIYERECRKLGREPGKSFGPSPGMPMSIHLSEDPDRSWATVEKHA